MSEKQYTKFNHLGVTPVMGFQSSYFKCHRDAPSPLVAKVQRRVRFEEIDVLGMVWHGRYASFFEDGRLAFGDKFGLTYHTFKKNRTVPPVVQMHVDYKIPLRFDDTIEIETSLYWAEAARLNFDYRITAATGETAASGYTVQLLTEPDGTVMLVAPVWLEKFKEKWLQGAWGE